jgi:hypothetical protein
MKRRGVQVFRCSGVQDPYDLTTRRPDLLYPLRGGTNRRRMLSLFAMMALVLLLPARSARADRIVLAPRGTVVLPNSLKAEYAVMADDTRFYLGWAAVRLPESLYGMELEAEQSRLAGKRRETFSLQYPLTSEAFSDIAPAISLGVRDVLNQGREGRAFFLAATKTFGLSMAQERLARDVKLHAGFGSGHLDGLYAGLTARFTLGFTVGVEYAARRFNAEVAVPFTRYFNLKAYTLDGEVFFGASLILAK